MGALHDLNVRKSILKWDSEVENILRAMVRLPNDELLDFLGAVESTMNKIRQSGEYARYLSDAGKTNLILLLLQEYERIHKAYLDSVENG